MSSFSMGRYVPYDSFLHKMDPRTKILALILLMVAVFIGYDTYAMTYLMAGVASIIVIALLWISHMSMRQVWDSLKSLWFMVIFLLLIYIITPRSEGHVAFLLGSYPIYYESFLEAGKILLRLMLMIELSLILTATTKPLDLTYALEWYMKPLSWIGFPSHVVAMTISLALRFIPTILDDVNRIMKAQSSRGVDFEHGKLSSKLRAIVSLIVPLFVSSFIRSDELANAMECRGYDPKIKRTRYRQLHFHYYDLIEAILVMGVAALFIYVSVSHFNAFSTWWGMIVW
ncbi:MAG: energy-coupling factor transporter transmembrane protein EcfT [Bacilli bacterium]|nr:energy-coupling factor transporter transmembrane protein EcfT [Bacilli bacterium]